ncbi:MAG: hypothetical protein HQ565_01175 [Bacteroidetes bacterium]|nr:hypothetical protein [Bacteroidota bacterium]
MRSILFLLSLVLLCSFSAEAQLFRKNKDDDTRKNGKYYEFWDEDSTRLSAKGHFCHDLPCKTWKYYDDKRKLYRIALYENGVEVEILSGPEEPVYFE